MVGKKNGNALDSGSNGHHFAAGDIVLGKIKGYPPWPGILCGEDCVPKKTVLSARPGKQYHIVRFFPAADYGFNTNRDLRLLSKREIEAYLSDSHKRAGDLRSAYKLALDPHEWNKEQDDAVREAEEADENEDQLVEEGDEEEDEQPVKKRKQPSSSSKSKPAPASKKVKSAPTEEREKKPSAAPVSSTSTSNAAPSHSHKDSAEVEGGEEAELDPETKKVKNWRHALQRGFLPKDGHINADDMEQHDKTFKQVEDYLEITASQLRLTKIGKVMKRILQLSNIPHDNTHHFQERAQKLCDRWSEVMAGGVKSAAGTGSVPSQSKKEESSAASLAPASAAAKEESSSAAPPVTTQDEKVSALPPQAPEESSKVNGGEQSANPIGTTNGTIITSNGSNVV